MKNMPTITNWDKLPVVLDVGTVCQILGCSDSTVKRYLRKGVIKGGQGDRLWHIDRDGVRDFVKGVPSGTKSNNN